MALDITALDITQIQLTDAERLMLAEVSERAGKPWAEVLEEALRQYCSTPRDRNGSERNGVRGDEAVEPARLS